MQWLYNYYIIVLLTGFASTSNDNPRWDDDADLTKLASVKFQNLLHFLLMQL